MISSRDAQFVAEQARSLLPSSPDAIAQWFAATGAYGQRGIALACPMANYLREVTGASHVQVTSDYASLYFDGPDGEIIVEIESTPGWEGFVDGFDRGLYPSLCMAATECVAS